MLGLNESPFIDSVVSMLRQEHSPESVRDGMNRARGAMASSTVRTAIKRETKKQRAKDKREAEIQAKAQRSRSTGRRR